jgi:thiamine-phosphate pyrophosphorylase
MPCELCVITDEAVSGGLPHAEIARRAVRGGADTIQLRDKMRSARDLARIGREILAVTRPAGALLIVNDRLDAALACGADGVHLGQGDLSCRVARQLSPAGFIIGVSVGNTHEARAAEEAGADYVALSPTFSTSSKSDAGPGHGLDRLRALRCSVKIPVIAIGGIGPDNIRAVIAAGADGIAVISAVVAAPDIEAAARDLKQRVRAAHREAGR